MSWVEVLHKDILVITKFGPHCPVLSVWFWAILCSAGEDPGVLLHYLIAMVFSRLLLMCVNECPNFHSLQTLKAMILSQLKKYRILKSCKLKIMTIFCPSGKAVATCFPVPLSVLASHSMHGSKAA